MKRQYTSDFKQEVLSFVNLHPAMTMKRIADDFGIPKDTLVSWVRGKGLKRSGLSLSENENEELRTMRKRLKELEWENTILKRAAAYFAGEMRPK